MIAAAAGLLLLALQGQPPHHAPYRWRDAAGQTQITDTPPPADAELLEAPPPPGVEPGKAARPDLVHPDLQSGYRQGSLSPAQQRAWEALDRRLARARRENDRPSIEAVTDSLIRDCLWGSGLWAGPMLPVLSVALLGLLGWWLALGLHPGPRLPLVAGFLLAGLLLGDVLLNVFLYHPQAARLRQNLELLEQHAGTGKSLRPDHRRLLQQRYRSLEQASEPLQAPWRFPAEVDLLRRAMKQVMVDP